MIRPMQLAAQFVIFLAFAAMLGYFSNNPGYAHVDPEKAVIKLSFSHAAHPIRECRRLTQEELNKLAPNMRRPLDCPRERVPVLVEVILNGELLYRASLPPSGLAGDGEATVYKRFVVEPGRHQLEARLRDSARQDGFDYQKTGEIELVAQQNFVIDFQAVNGGFIFM